MKNQVILYEKKFTYYCMKKIIYMVRDYIEAYNYDIYMDLINNKYIDYLNSLEVYVVSGGGVSSNYMNSYLARKGIVVGERDSVYGWNLCHSKVPLTNKPKTLYIYGDWENAIYSQAKRNLIQRNSNKIHKCQNTTDDNLKHYLKIYDKDPYGLREQYKNFITHENTYYLKYPYTKDDVQKVLKEMGFFFETDDFEIKPRTIHNTKVSNIIDKIINVYKKHDPYEKLWVLKSSV